MTSGAVVLLVAVGLTLAAGSWRLVADGRFRGTRDARSTSRGAGTKQEEPAGEVAPTPAGGVVRRAGHELGERVTLLQFSSAFCAPCRATRQVLSGVAASVDGVTHVEVDAEQHLDATRELGVLRTPTTLVLDAGGREIARASGPPTRAQVLAAVTEAIR